MAANSPNEIVLARTLELFNEERKTFYSSARWKQFIRADTSLYETAEKTPNFDPRFNAVHWAFDLSGLCRQIVFSYLWMNAYARFYKDTVSPGSLPAHTNFYVTYFADNCITRLDSSRDKLALLVWAFYCPFNPEKRNEVIDYPKVIERLEHPVRFALRMKGVVPFLRCLKLLDGDEFRRVERYRHLKIHRREPRIEIYGVAPHHDWSYMLPLTDEREIARWEKELERLYPNDSSFRQRLRAKSRINGTLFEQRRLRDHLWSFSAVQKDLESSLFKVLEATTMCFHVLRKRLLSTSRQHSVRVSIRHKRKDR